MNKLTVLLVDDHEGFINAAMRHFRKIDWLQIVGSAGNGLEAIERSETLRPQVVLMDLAMPEMGGLQATRLIKSQGRCTVHRDRQPLRRRRAPRARAARRRRQFRQQAVLHPGSHADPGRPQGGSIVSESRILVLDNDAVRAERTVALLEFMDFNPRWVSDAADFDLGRQRQNDWMAVIVGSLDDSPASTALYHWLGGSSLPPPVLLADGDGGNVRPPARPARSQHLAAGNAAAPCADGSPAAPRQPQAPGRRAPGRRRAGPRGRPATARRLPRCAP